MAHGKPTSVRVGDASTYVEKSSGQEVEQAFHATGEVVGEAGEVSIKLYRGSCQQRIGNRIHIQAAPGIAS